MNKNSIGQSAAESLGRERKEKKMKLEKIKHGDGRYSIREDGVIINTITNKEMSTCKTDDGKYLRIKINGGGESKEYRVHFLVATAFIDNPNNYKEVNHLDGNGHNNHKDNLEWSTRRENMVHSVTNDLAGSKLDTNKVREICKIIIDHPEYTNLEIGEKYGVKHTAISNIRLGKSWVEITKEFGFKKQEKTNNTKHRRKLTDEQVIEICHLLNTRKDLSAVKIGEMFGVAKTTINDISAGNTYQDITDKYLINKIK